MKRLLKFDKQWITNNFSEPGLHAPHMEIVSIRFAKTMPPSLLMRKHFLVWRSLETEKLINSTTILHSKGWSKHNQMTGNDDVTQENQRHHDSKPWSISTELCIVNWLRIQVWRLAGNYIKISSYEISASRLPCWYCKSGIKMYLMLFLANIFDCFALIAIPTAWLLVALLCRKGHMGCRNSRCLISCFWFQAESFMIPGRLPWG